MNQINKKLANKVALISGGSRGIGAQTAITLAKHGCDVVIIGKTSDPHPKLEGTIHTVAEACERHGVKALAIQCDIRDEVQIQNVFQKIKEEFGQLDYLINSASAIFMHTTEELTVKEFDLMHQINVRGTYLMSQAALDLLKISDNAHIVNFAPPLVLDAQYFRNHLGYTMAKYGMSMCTLGMAHEFYHQNIAVNSLWPRTAIKTAATDYLFDNNTNSDQFLRKADIMADAVLEIIVKPSKVCTGCFLIDDLVLMGAGVEDFDQYAVAAGNPLIADLFLPHDLPPPPNGTIIKDNY